MKASLIVQTATCMPLFAWYVLVSGMTLYTGMTVVPLAQMQLPGNATLYFISSDDGSVRALGGAKSERVHDLRSSDSEDRLFVRRSPADAGRWDICARMETGEDDRPRIVVVRPDMAVVAAPDWLAEDKERPRLESTWMNRGPAAQLGDAVNSEWKLWSGFWALEGLRARNSSTGEECRIAMETPFVAWNVRNVTHLPGDLAVFQLGEDQICIADIKTRRIALITHGRGPVVVLETGPVHAATQPAQKN